MEVGKTIVTRHSINIIIFKMKVESHKVDLENAEKLSLFFPLKIYIYIYVCIVEVRLIGGKEREAT